MSREMVCYWHILCLKLAFKNIFTLVYIGPHKTWQMMKTYKAGVWIYKHISKIKQKERAEGKKKNKSHSFACLLMFLFNVSSKHYCTIYITSFHRSQVVSNIYICIPCNGFNIKTFSVFIWTVFYCIFSNHRFLAFHLWTRNKNFIILDRYHWWTYIK